MALHHIGSMPTVLLRSDRQPSLRFLWRWSWLIVLCALCGAGLAFSINLTTVPVYEASSKLLINEARTPAAANYNDILASERTARTYAELMTRESTLRQAMERVGVSPGLTAQQIDTLRVIPVRDTQLIELTVEGPNPELITAIANTLPQVFVEELRSIQTSRFSESKASLRTQLDALSREIEETRLAMDGLEDAHSPQEELEYGRLGNLLSQYQTSYSGILQNYETIRLAEAQAVDNIVLMDPAVVPNEPVRPRMLLNTLLAALIGGMLALGAVVLARYMDDRIQTPDDLRRLTDLPVLAAIAGTSEKAVQENGAATLISLREPRHPSTEAYRRLRTNLQYQSVDEPLGILVITSAGAGEGKSVTAANLAVVMAQAGLKVVLIDGDLRRPRLHQLFGMSRSPGLAEAMLGDGLIPFMRAPAGVENLRVVTSGTEVPLPAEILGSERMRTLVEQVGKQSDVVLFDSPPVLAVADAQILGRLANGAVLVIDAQQTTAGALARTLEALQHVNVPVLGGVLNRLPDSQQGYYYLYGYHHNHCDSEGNQNGRPNRTVRPVFRRPLRPMPQAFQKSGKRKRK